MKQNTATKSTPNLAVAHGSMDFFHYLQERPAERFSRFEAYIYMLDKACACFRPDNIEKKWIPAIGDGQFFITKTQLAIDWHWHRATVRDYLAKLTEFGHLVIEEHLKGILCTMPHLIIPATPSIALSYNFDAMAKYTMYSWADGKLKPHQVERICGQIERSASFMLSGNIVSPYIERQLEDTTRMILHYAIEAIIAHHPGRLSAAGEIGCSPTFVEKRLLEFFRGHLAGNWQHLLTLLYKRTAVALDALVRSVSVGRTEREAIWQELRQQTDTLLGIVPPEDNAGDSPAQDSESANPSDTSEESGIASEEAPSLTPSDKPSESV